MKNSYILTIPLYRKIKKLTEEKPIIPLKLLVFKSLNFGSIVNSAKVCKISKEYKGTKKHFSKGTKANYIWSILLKNSKIFNIFYCYLTYITGGIRKRR